MAALVRGLPLPETFVTEIDAGLRGAGRSGPVSPWRRMLRQPALWAVMLAVRVSRRLRGRRRLRTHDRLCRATTRSARSSKPPAPARTRTTSNRSTPSAASSATNFSCSTAWRITRCRRPSRTTRRSATGCLRRTTASSRRSRSATTGTSMTFLVFRADQQGVNIHPPGHWKFLRRRRLDGGRDGPPPHRFRRRHARRRRGTARLSGKSEVGSRRPEDPKTPGSKAAN